MLHTATDINRLIQQTEIDPDFPYAPLDWSRDEAIAIAQAEGIKPTQSHWEAVRALQRYYAQHADEATINLRGLHDALDEHFHHQGGLRYLYTLFPGGPIAQVCRMAGLKAPAIASDPSFGSVA